MIIVKSLKNAGLLIKVVTGTVRNEVKEQKGGFLGMLAASLASSLIESILSIKGVVRADNGTIR